MTHIANKREWPDWTPPPQMLRRRPDLPRHMEGGLDNPLGARAMYLAGTLYRIHGSNEPDTIGQAVSSGCIRMTNDDVVDLYSRAQRRRPGRRHALTRASAPAASWRGGRLSFGQSRPLCLADERPCPARALRWSIPSDGRSPMCACP